MELVQLAHDYDPVKHFTGGWWWSIKYNGERCFWDGGISRGKPKSSVPFAKTDKDYRYRETQYATGLWTRYGNVIHAPDYFLDNLGDIPLDGELYSRILTRQQLFSTIKDLVPGPDWKAVEYYVFDIPVPIQYETAYYRLQKIIHPPLQLVTQTPLPLRDSGAEIERLLAAHPNEEGIMIRNPVAIYRKERVWTLLKYKHTYRGEGVITGIVEGKGKLEGVMGSVIVDGRIGVSGFTMEERRTVKVGDRIAYIYSGLSDDGIPMEARRA